MVIFQIVIADQLRQSIAASLDGNAENDVVVGEVGGKVWLPETTSGNAAIDVVGAGCIHPSGNYKQIVNIGHRMPMGLRLIRNQFPESVQSPRRTSPVQRW